MTGSLPPNAGDTQASDLTNVDCAIKFWVAEWIETDSFPKKMDQSIYDTEPALTSPDCQDSIGKEYDTRFPESIRTVVSGLTGSDIPNGNEVCHLICSQGCDATYMDPTQYLFAAQVECELPLWIWSESACPTPPRAPTRISSWLFVASELMHALLLLLLLLLVVVIGVALLCCCCGGAAFVMSKARKQQKNGDAEQGSGGGGGVAVVQAPQPAPVMIIAAPTHVAAQPTPTFETAGAP